MAAAIAWSAYCLFAIGEAIAEDDGIFSFMGAFLFAAVWLVPWALGAVLYWVVPHPR